ncbi:MAG: helix-hairpin-helix domain-containing protein [Smithellaceae bacterium]|jgi:competence protein ComEA|nr:helix-hairpin-helix domain-containing protein [Smithellaceae bacterium]MDD3257959.1 helix-hairpin-helix domain-containing protein [Smithellaceae bacterium]MDD3848351.1 helix-hairpin-helix domain-containing protein [Smithellaceae bacterium]HOG11486.1 helix-hairpin-helix domain-containing protein [Smithellaceae bacterium]HOQ71383.1 helix-hairpin-helix domain-containing protein [Smithellaceae bacterium]
MLKKKRFLFLKNGFTLAALMLCAALIAQTAAFAQAAEKSAGEKLPPAVRVNINKADQATLEKLLGIGPVKAKAIIDGRPYRNIEDVMNIKGIKGKTYDAIKEHIVVK